MITNPIRKIPSMNGDIVRKTAYGVATRGIGAAPRILAEQATQKAVSSAAQRAANRFSAKNQTANTQNNKSGGDSSPDGDGSDNGEGDDGAKKKKLVGPMFWLMLLVTILKDVVDIVGDFTVIFSWIAIIVGPIVSFIVLFYLLMNGVKPDTRKVVSFMLSVVLGWTPYLNLLPETTLNLVLIRIFENSAFAKKAMSTVGKKS